MDTALLGNCGIKITLQWSLKSMTDISTNEQVILRKNQKDADHLFQDGVVARGIRLALLVVGDGLDAQHALLLQHPLAQRRHQRQITALHSPENKRKLPPFQYFRQIKREQSSAKRNRGMERKLWGT